LPVVLEGESGTGKERFAKALHEWSGRKGPFLAVNCAAYSKSIAAAELFCYEKGAFTGAERESPGHIRAAEGGTLLLDELSELPFDVQAMLLRVIENREVLPLGDSRPRAVDVRFVAATQEPLAACVATGRFRADLRARFEGTAIRLPPLRLCKELVPDLFCALFERHAAKRPALTAQYAERLCVHDWPLNVRELDTFVRHLAISHRAEAGLDLDALNAALGAPANDAATARDATGSTSRAEKSVPGRTAAAPYRREEVELLVETLARNAGNITKAASELGISRQKAYRMLEAVQSDRTDGSGESNGSV